MKNLFKTLLVVFAFVLSTTSAQAQQNSKDLNIKQLEGVFRAAVYQKCHVKGKIDIDLTFKVYHGGSTIAYFNAFQKNHQVSYTKAVVSPGGNLKPSDLYQSLGCIVIHNK